MLGETLADLVRQSAHGGVVEVVGQARVLVAPLALDLLVLALDVAAVLRLHVHLQRHLHGEPLLGTPFLGALAHRLDQRRVGNLRPPQQVERALLARQRPEARLGARARVRAGPHPGGLQALQFALDRGALGFEELPARVVDEAELAARWA